MFINCRIPIQKLSQWTLPSATELKVCHHIISQENMIAKVHIPCVCFWLVFLGSSFMTFSSLNGDLLGLFGYDFMHNIAVRAVCYQFNFLQESSFLIFLIIKSSSSSRVSPNMLVLHEWFSRMLLFACFPIKVIS